MFFKLLNACRSPRISSNKQALKPVAFQVMRDLGDGGGFPAAIDSNKADNIWFPRVCPAFRFHCFDKVKGGRIKEPGKNLAEFCKNRYINFSSAKRHIHKGAMQVL